MVKKEKPVVVWNTRASIYFRKAYEYIKEESYTNAEKVRNGIVKVIDSLTTTQANTHSTSLRKTIGATTAHLKNTPIELLISIRTKKFGLFVCGT